MTAAEHAGSLAHGDGVISHIQRHVAHRIFPAGESLMGAGNYCGRANTVRSTS